MDFIEVLADFSLSNGEDAADFTYGWTMFRSSDSLDITIDGLRHFYETDIRKMHVDNNVLEINNYYDLTFTITALNTDVKFFYASKTIQIYIGVAPENGDCLTSETLVMSGSN